ncbi:hypothetical protein SKAU_G00204410 [Synaphobranchus kaupii]|uniref:Uncharacterized protein n=1 Tax=Synaphobranchus kaupii TaxID=118154 RepID=A0A9Q1FGE9_SYNKA|nr:hypothetical protein SKAU_G00204410 [Synaphobranchus kaupii]
MNSELKSRAPLLGLSSLARRAGPAPLTGSQVTMAERWALRVRSAEDDERTLSQEVAGNSHPARGSLTHQTRKCSWATHVDGAPRERRHRIASSRDASVDVGNSVGPPRGAAFRVSSIRGRAAVVIKENMEREGGERNRR